MRSLSDDLKARQGALCAQLLAARDEAGVWRGELSSSALSTATAIVALELARRAGVAPEGCQGLLAAGRGWLEQNQNEDGGFGDTTRSVSNVSTTCLCWGALGLVDASEPASKAEAWITRHAGGTRPQQLRAALLARYGKDQTFSVPILTLLAITGRLGEGQKGFAWVPQLPFELAAFPRSWFRALRLRVVSYALPALIAIGRLRHHHAPSWNPFTRALRAIAGPRALRVLASVQPQNGGFLEATPLTSFVTMSLIAAGDPSHSVVQRGLAFIAASARGDGSWAIDSNLETWVTTLAIKALAADGQLSDRLPLEQRSTLRDWLLNQQYREQHPYTDAAPGGWSWTALPGGVPDADDTPGALLALKALDPDDPAVLEAASAGIRWLLDLQNRDGGIPTFCCGWGQLPFDRSSQDLTAHTLAAWEAWSTELPPRLRRRVSRAQRRALRYLARSQRSDGAFVPLWFGNEDAPCEENPVYGTSRVLLALGALARRDETTTLIRKATAYLEGCQHPSGGWGGAAGCAPSIEETALALEGLAACASGPRPALRDGLDWLLTALARDRDPKAKPIGFYFAKLWYFERLYPLLFATAGVNRASRIDWSEAKHR